METKTVNQQVQDILDKSISDVQAIINAQTKSTDIKFALALSDENFYEPVLNAADALHYMTNKEAADEVVNKYNNLFVDVKYNTLSDLGVEVWSIEHSHYQTIDIEDIADNDQFFDGWDAPHVIESLLELANLVLEESDSRAFTCIKKYSVDELRVLVNDKDEVNDGNDR